MVDKLVHHHDYTHHLHYEQGDDIFMTSPLNHLEVSLVGKSEYVIVEGTEKLAAVTSGSEAFFATLLQIVVVIVVIIIHIFILVYVKPTIIEQKNNGA